MKKFNFEGGQKLSREEMKKVAGGFRDVEQGCSATAKCKNGTTISCSGLEVVLPLIILLSHVLLKAGQLKMNVRNNFILTISIYSYEKL